MMGIPHFTTIRELSSMLNGLNFKDKADPEVLNIDLEVIVHFMDGIMRAQTEKDPFNAAANVVKQFCNIYGRRVDHLHESAEQLNEKVELQIADKHPDPDSNPDTQAPKKPTRKKSKCSEGVFDEFYADAELKLGKNLGLVTNRSSKRFTTKRSLQKAVYEEYCHEPVDLIFIEGEYKGPPFCNTKGDVIGNQNDFTLNRCMATRYGWNLLPICNSRLIKKEGDPPDYDIRLECGNLYFPYPDDKEDARNNKANDDDAHNEETHDDDVHNDDVHDDDVRDDDSLVKDIPLSPDEGLGPSLPCSQQTKSTQESVPTLSQDEGIGGSSSDTGRVEEGIEEDPNNVEDLNNFSIGEDPEPSVNFPFNKTILPESDVNLIRRKCRKKDLPEKLERFKAGLKPKKPLSLAMYCSRTFAAPDPKIAKEMASAGMHMHTKAFMNYKNFYSTLAHSMQTLKEKKQKRVCSPKEDEDVEDTPDVCSLDLMGNDGQGSDAGAIEEPRDASPMPDLANCDEVLSIGNDVPPSTSILDECPLVQTDERVLDPDEVERAEIDMMQHEAFDDVSFLKDQPEVERAAAEWREIVDPYLSEVETRKTFDINQYKMDILNAFPSGEAKQGKHTISFREFCKDMPQYEVHRYFTALLPLVNVENVSIESKCTGSSTEDIDITLLHRNLHHEDIEKFGDKVPEH